MPNAAADFLAAETVTNGFERMMCGGRSTKLKCRGAEFGDAFTKHMSGSNASGGSVEPKSKPAMAGA